MSKAGERGQVRAIAYTWRLTRAIVGAIRSAGILVNAVCGREDVMAPWHRGARIAYLLGGTTVVTPAGHFVTLESARKVNAQVAVAIIAVESASWIGSGRQRPSEAEVAAMAMRRADSEAGLGSSDIFSFTPRGKGGGEGRVELRDRDRSRPRTGTVRASEVALADAGGLDLVAVRGR